ncbi:hypothetical protein T09_8015 [Trichinella sp. T9]|nr:hypothetical protein T09_8015 [Trichinella sp. T9]
MSQRMRRSQKIRTDCQSYQLGRLDCMEARSFQA